ncbi:hypothetical protein OZX67_03825 [Bifidobacterium sp. ESL0728]|uniref:hypothetical protein n=1 Tax=Bifidobacterium sp. ESL0728 TaxID=2983220 RepID=UPI0023F65155|nr:hypothetical protein [Bifidobacterium sp. ESL0728]WEV59676.1 hypothetical protein OZX67_03825 [Bifidobacterium sp. ESL0728]
MNGLGIFGGTTIEYRNPTYTRDHGSLTLTWPEEWQTLDGCDLQDPATAVDSKNREGTLNQYTLYMPEGSPVADNAQVRVNNQMLQVDGMVLRFPDPLEILAYCKATLKAWKG